MGAEFPWAGSFIVSGSVELTVEASPERVGTKTRSLAVLELRAKEQNHPVPDTKILATGCSSDTENPRFAGSLLPRSD